MEQLELEWSSGAQSTEQGCESNSQGLFIDPIIELVTERLKEVKNKLVILSGKGGVGKSTVVMMISRFMAQSAPEENFGILDADICGHSQTRILGVKNKDTRLVGSGRYPVRIEPNIRLMSIGFLLPSPDDAVMWCGYNKTCIIRQFLIDADWGDLDLLILDTPPRRSDEQLSVFKYLNDSDTNDIPSLSALIVTTPQKVSILNIRKEIIYCKNQQIPIVGVIENMSSFNCENCGKTSEIFISETDGVAAMCKEMNVQFLGTLPLDPEIAKVCDNGLDITSLKSATKEALEKICNKITDRLRTNKHKKRDPCV